MTNGAKKSKKKFDHAFDVIRSFELDSKNMPLQIQSSAVEIKDQRSVMSEYKHLVESQRKLSPSPRPETPNPWYHHQKR